ncbi:MAG: LptF/LptG family permease [Candidatus Hydrogenedens sp.]|nr:LptF/LptG family permease [Candidatus Hydrogenedens sp.]
MTLFDRYLLRQLLGTIVRVCIAFIGIFVLIDLLSARVEKIAKYDVPPWTVVEFYLFQIPVILFEYNVFAVAVLASGLMVFGRLAQNQELTALLAGGVSLRRVALPGLALALLLSGCVFTFTETLGVQASALQRDIEYTYFRRTKDAERGPRSWANLGTDKWTCHVLSFNPLALTGQDVFLHLNRPDRVEEIRAGRIFWEPERGQWLLEDGYWYRFDPQQEWAGSSTRITQTPAPFDAAPEELFALEQPAGGKSIVTLAEDIARAERLNTPTHNARIALNEKVSRPLIGFIMMLLALPFAARIRRGGIAVGFGASLAIAMVYLFIHFGAVGLGHLGLLPAWFAAWIANIVFFAFGVAMFRRTPT